MFVYFLKFQVSPFNKKLNSVFKEKMPRGFSKQAGIAECRHEFQGLTLYKRKQSVKNLDTDVKVECYLSNAERHEKKPGGSEICRDILQYLLKSFAVFYAQSLVSLLSFISPALWIAEISKIFKIFHTSTPLRQPTSSSKNWSSLRFLVWKSELL